MAFPAKIVLLKHISFGFFGGNTSNPPLTLAQSLLSPPVTQLLFLPLLRPALPAQGCRSPFLLSHGELWNEILLALQSTCFSHISLLRDCTSVQEKKRWRKRHRELSVWYLWKVLEKIWVCPERKIITHGPAQGKTEAEFPAKKHRWRANAAFLEYIAVTSKAVSHLVLQILKELKPLVWVFVIQNVPEVVYLIYLLYTVRGARLGSPPHPPQGPEVLPHPSPAAPAASEESRAHPASPGSALQDRDQVKLLLNWSKALGVPAKNDEGKMKQNLVQDTQLPKNAFTRSLEWCQSIWPALSCFILKNFSGSTHSCPSCCSQNKAVQAQQSPVWGSFLAL